MKIVKGRGGIVFEPSPGGLVSGTGSLTMPYERLWIGWPGMASEKLTAKDKAVVTSNLTEQNYYPVFLSNKQVKGYYEGFCNKTIWPLFHYFSLRAVFEGDFWEAYKEVNEIFCEKVLSIAKPTDRIWIHDYQLLLLANMIRQRQGDAEIGFFLHIPFPSWELFRLLPWREEILNGLLGADLIGFHTHDYVRHFLSSVYRLLGFEHTLGRITEKSRIVKADVFPMGIDYEKYSEAANDSEVKHEITNIRQRIGDRKIILSVDRLDYTKGIINRLENFDLFLRENPVYRGKVVMIMVAVPTRENVEEYISIRKELEQLVGRVNGEHGTIDWAPVRYLYRSLQFSMIVALYNAADVALVTPLRDGMNLIAKEFIASKKDGRGVLILSELTGAASELGEALIVNPHNKAEVVKAMVKAMEMPVEEQIYRNRVMQKRLSRYTVSRWASDFLSALDEIKNVQKEFAVNELTEVTKNKIIADFQKSHRRLLFLDYDGTLVQFKGKPEEAKPDAEIMATLMRLAGEPKNELVIISGRNKETMADWLGMLDAVLVAEHGAWIRQRGKQWEAAGQFQSDWKETIRPVLELYVDRTPGAMIEEKDFSLVWHFRMADAELAKTRIQELKHALVNLTANLEVGVFEGNKIIEIKSHGISKGHIAGIWVAKEKWDFILAAGDDYTDEDMFAAIPAEAYSIKVGYGMSKAKFNAANINEMRLLLEKLTEG